MCFDSFNSEIKYYQTLVDINYFLFSTYEELVLKEMFFRLFKLNSRLCSTNIFESIESGTGSTQTEPCEDNW